jgi:hypothetical protein
LWRDVDGDVLSLGSLGILTESFWHSDRPDEIELRKWCRGLAESRGGGLIEAFALDGEVRLIYKRLQKPAYTYTGMLIARVRQEWLIWTMVAGERGTTGVREAVVTANLMDAGKLTIDDYKLYWAQDPYEPTYRGVDRSVLRFMSDDEIYDEQFPQHPLSKVRRNLATLPNYVEYGPFVAQASRSADARND